MSLLADMYLPISIVLLAEIRYVSANKLCHMKIQHKVFEGTERRRFILKINISITGFLIAYFSQQFVLTLMPLLYTKLIVGTKGRQ